MVLTIRTPHMILERSAVTRACVIERGLTMAEEQWTVKDLVEALRQFPEEAKVYYEMGPNGPGTIRKGAIRQGLGRRRSDGSASGPLDGN